MFNPYKSKGFYGDPSLDTWKTILGDEMIYSVTRWLADNLIHFENVSTALSVGCGWGGIERKILSNYSNIKIDGITNVESQVEFINSFNDPNFIATVYDANKFTTNNYYDLIYFSESVSHLSDTAITNLSKNTNKFLLVDWFSHDRNCIKINEWDLYIRTKDYYKSLFNSIGFNVRFETISSPAIYDNQLITDHWLKGIQALPESERSLRQIVALEKMCEDFKNRVVNKDGSYTADKKSTIPYSINNGKDLDKPKNVLSSCVIFAEKKYK